MRLSKVSGWLATLLVVATAFGAVASLLTGLVLDGLVATALVVVLVVGAVAAASRAGARSRRWLSNGGYW